VELGLTGRRAIVTGGSKGLGKAIASSLVAEGVAVTICSRNAAELQATADEISKEAAGGSGQVIVMVCDVTAPDQVTGFVESATETMGGLDILVNNAGGARPGQFGTLTDDDWHADIEVKLFSQIRCTRAALPHLRRSQAARVININAVYARYPDPVFLASSVNRASCLSLSKALSIDLGHDQILVNSVNIGFVLTPQWQNIHQLRAPDLPAEEFFGRMAAAEVPMGRFGDPEEVAGLVTFLASDRASYITGASIDVAGGMGKFL
jgi:NAD(P)-dependent dehydrogenase (short-subunit alcohol dehydrogenase family)